MKHLVGKRTAIVAVGSSSAVVLASGVAYAFWSTSAAGNAAVASGTSVSLAITGVSGTGALAPGGLGDVKLLITNTNKANVSLTALVMSNSGISGFTDQTFSTAKSGCTTTGVTWVATAKSLTPIVIAANGGTYTLTLTGAAQMDTTSDDGCQSTYFKMPVTSGTATLVATTASSPTNGAQ